MRHGLESLFEIISKERRVSIVSGKILVLGSTGRLGSCINNSADFGKDSELLLHSRKLIGPLGADLTSRVETFKMLEEIKPSAIINTVALAEIEACEKNPNRAYRNNVLTTQNVVDWIDGSSTDCHLVHISTDHVYDGQGVHKEDSVELTNYYAYSKFASELVAQRISSTILRTNFVGMSASSLRQTFSDWVIRNLKNKNRIELVNDIFFSPVPLDFLIQALSLSVREKLDLTANVGSWGGMTKFEFGSKVGKLIGLDVDLIDSVTAEECLGYNTYRPNNMVMDNLLWEKASGIKCPTTDEVVASVACEYM
jgi:dTDP-4-dehydrorhamnose reductase